jgi:hypothetical protein
MRETGGPEQRIAATEQGISGNLSRLLSGHAFRRSIRAQYARQLRQF